ncbi:MAG: hypothetical protein CVU14_00910 [Bacteroidetes bacterium HGW-Bacteroidetes-9]|jgi:hypothetical protein|nr:MAG: hypothetical protein CVU14_00910 [Bacteroidetes bacterium HGW-Bacteroidetes-9]
MKKKFFFIAGITVVVILAVIIWWRYYFVFGEGVKAGNLNFFVKKGYVFKTWEGRLIQDGFKTPVPGSIQSNEFEFSVTDDSIAAKLERCGGRFVELRYKEYLNPLPWRGMSNYKVTEILQIGNGNRNNSDPFPYDGSGN